MHKLRYAITDRTQYGKTMPDQRAGLIAQAERLATQGVEYIQLREKDLPARDLVALAREILYAIRQFRPGTKLLINSRADIALTAGADGVHLPSGDEQLTPARVRRLFGHHSDPAPERSEGEGEESPHLSHAATGSKLIVSVSCHTLAEVERARENGADLILFGPVFAKSVAGKIVVPGIGLDALATACAIAAGTPVLALGGVTEEDSATTLAAGAAGVAAIRLFR